MTPFPAPTGCKRGVAQNAAPGGDFLASGSSPGVVWWYDWGTNGSGQAGGIEFDPMIWSGPVPSNAPQASYLLTFNEPDNGSQSNMSPSQAAGMWPAIESLAKKEGIKYIVSPAVASSVTWMQNFVSACSGCQIDFIAVHFYGCLLHSTPQWQGLAEYLEQFYQFNKPIWLTEFSCDASQTVQQQTAYMQAAIPYLESLNWVYRYSWFNASPIPNAMLAANENGALNALGQVYVSLPAACK